MDTTVSDPMVGRVLDNRYRVDAHLARGGMAVVYRAHDLRLDRTVAVKVMQPALAEDDEFVSRFIREARSAARLSHPNVVAVFDQGTDGRDVFLAMEYVEGRTLRDLLVDRGPLTPRHAFEILEPVLAALATAHQAGYVHRDVKPENVLLSDEGHVKVADFGLARTMAAPTAVTRSSAVLIGTVAYLAPEQVQRGVSDARSDVYAAGILLYELLTGHTPHDGESALAVAYQHVHADVPPPSTRVPGLPAEVDALVARATSRDPGQRPENAAELGALLARVRSSLSPDQLDAGGGQAGDDMSAPSRHTLVVPVAPADASPAGQATQVVSRSGRAGHRAGGTPHSLGPSLRRRWPVLVALTTVLTLLVGLGAWWLGSGQYTDTPNLVGMTKAEALAALREQGLEMYVADEHRFSETVPHGHIVATDPGAREQVSSLGGVTVVLSKGKERYAVPEVTGMPLDVAERSLEARHLAVGGTPQRYSTEVAKDHVLRATPAPGEMVKRDTAVRLVVSKGPPPVTVPDVRNRTKEEAAAILEQYGLAVSYSVTYSDQVPAGYVVTQRPAPGASVGQGSAVQVVVSQGQELYEVPNVVGLSAEDAVATLEEAGFIPSVQGVPDGTVQAQTPQAGEQHPQGTTVTCWAWI